MTSTMTKNSKALSPEAQELIKPRSWSTWISWIFILGALALSWKGVEMDPLMLWRDAGNMSKFAEGFFPPDFHDWRYYLEEMVLTVEIAL